MARDIIAAAEAHGVWPAPPELRRRRAACSGAEHELRSDAGRLATASEFGSLALAREDRTAARFVASRAAVQARFLQGLAAVSEASTCTQSGCLGAALPVASTIEQATASLAVPGVIDAAAWAVVWDEASLAIGGRADPGGGIPSVRLSRADFRDGALTRRLRAVAASGRYRRRDASYHEDGWTSGPPPGLRQPPDDLRLVYPSAHVQAVRPVAGFLDRVGSAVRRPR